ncbi:MAG: hypothetical protein D6776_01115, partial [Planctomycetota bacterium]
MQHGPRLLQRLAGQRDLALLLLRIGEAPAVVPPRAREALVQPRQGGIVPRRGRAGAAARRRGAGRGGTARRRHGPLRRARGPVGRHIRRP